MAVPVVSGVSLGGPGGVLGDPRDLRSPGSVSWSRPHGLPVSNFKSVTRLKNRIKEPSLIRNLYFRFQNNYFGVQNWGDPQGIPAGGSEALLAIASA